MSKCNKLAQKKEYKTSYPWELGKRLNFDYSIKWYMHKPESVQENGTHKIFRDLKIKTDDLIPVTKSDLVINNKNKIVELALLFDSWVKVKESEKVDK